MKDDYLVIDKKVLPEIFQKVIDTKKLIENGDVKGITEATKVTGISRSVFYKYKDAVYLYHGKAEKQIVTIQVVLYDRPGVLMAVISAFYNEGANILTINQNIPVNGTALVSISCQVDHLKGSMDDLLLHLKQVDGVQRIEHITGE